MPFILCGVVSARIARGLDALRSGAIRMSAIADQELPQIQALMSQYADRLMDFADATLAYLAIRDHLNFAIDHDDFESYRLPGRKKFAVLPLSPRRQPQIAA